MLHWVVLAMVVSGCGDGGIFIGNGGGDDGTGDGIVGGLDVDCGAGAYSTPTVEGECVTDTIGCGDEVFGTSVGGSTFYDIQVWEGAMCLDWLLSEGGDLDAAERVYEFFVPGDQYADVILEAPCANLELRVVPTSTECAASPNTCSVGSGDWDFQKVSALVDNNGADRRYEIVVDGYNGAEGNYKLSTSCYTL